MPAFGSDTAALSQAPGGSLKKGRNNEVSALFNSCLGKPAVQIPAQAVTGRFRCLTVVAAGLADPSVIPAPE